MTCVAGIVDTDKIVMAADSLVVSGDFSIHWQGEKIFRCGPMTIGVAGSWRIAQLLRYQFQPPTARSGIDTYLVKEFADAVFELCVKYEEDLVDDDNAETNLLIAFRSNLHVMGADYTVSGPYSFEAIGTGGPLAKGALAAQYELGIKNTTEERLRIALGIAEDYCPSVRSPFQVVTIDHKRNQ